MFQKLRDKAEDLWPVRGDLRPKTLREDAMLDVVCALIDQSVFGLQDKVYEDRVARAMNFLEPYALRVHEMPTGEDGFDLIMQVYAILKGDQL